jgi:hypothetical protein
MSIPRRQHDGNEVHQPESGNGSIESNEESGNWPGIEDGRRQRAVPDWQRETNQAQGGHGGVEGVDGWAYRGRIQERGWFGAVARCRHQREEFKQEVTPQTAPACFHFCRRQASKLRIWLAPR